MENFIIYLCKTSALLSIFYIAYYALLRKETFFNSNRRFLLIGLITSAVLPLLVFTRTVWVEPVVLQELNAQDIQQAINAQELNITEQTKGSPINWIAVAIGFYLAGMLFFIGRFLNELRNLKNMLKNQPFLKRNGFKYIDTPAVSSPFSFFNYIVYNSKVLSETELENILQHEKVHSSQKHSLDMVISQLFCSFFWFNPFAWLYKKAIAQNLEFIADSEACKKVNDVTAYQKTLLKITVQPEEGNTAIVNQFYQSLIKKRIVMLNTKQSSLLNKWKYATVLPILVLFMFAFQLEVNAQEKGKKANTAYSFDKSVKLELLITKDTKKEELEKEKDFLKEQFNVDLNYSDIKYNNNEELIGIKIITNNGKKKKEYHISGTEPITPFAIIAEQKNGKNVEIDFSSQTLPVNAKGHVYIKSDEDDINITNEDEITAIVVGNTSDTDKSESKTGFWSVDNVKINNKELLIVIDGKKQEKGETIQIPVNRAIDVIKTLERKEAKKKYGRDGRKGAIEITTKKDSDLGTGVIIKSDLKGLKSDAIKMYSGKGVAVIDSRDLQEEAYNRTKKLLIKTEQQLNDNEEMLVYSNEEQEEVRRALKEARKEVESTRKEMINTRKELSEKRRVLQLERAKQIEERSKIKDERAKQREEWNKVKEEIKKAKEEN
ncbi:hypothetical protein GCM10007424_05130 [Flavobacterium suaedae]|uniref:Peptidase M56 domain-containing protein n=1 Tax=Flavobacterium suaedae TaxID=1767027 RepID=A0ABQ1JG67_9FLAO|nr:M56 family metallopeptidase [Flavobacterium suaedae]GGB68112.1 hypothetical protein GCM10007424_05130 [Flavobacterium suaedae]